ncbi:MAG: hypothetical protein FJ335_08165 [Sphingomonadales bacterium]|nr:hypothetical protein [Sphingomonadales bacterium]
MGQLLADIETFLDKHQLPPTRFGDEALGDRHFVRQLRRGRRVWPETEKKVRAFMEERGGHESDPASLSAEASPGKSDDVAAQQVAA